MTSWSWSRFWGAFWGALARDAAAVGRVFDAAIPPFLAICIAKWLGIL